MPRSRRWQAEAVRAPSGARQQPPTSRDPAKRRLARPQAVPRQHAAAARRHRRADRGAGRAAGAWAAARPRSRPTSSPTFVLSALSATNLTMLVALAFVLTRNILKLVVERRRALPFARFRAKLVRSCSG